MTRFLSHDWVAELDQVLRAAVVPSGGERLVIQQRVNAEPPIEWHVDLGAGGGAAAVGRSPSPTIELHQDLRTAVAVARGDISAEEALLTGRISVRGDIEAAARHRARFGDLSAALDTLRDRTEYPEL